MRAEFYGCAEGKGDNISGFKVKCKQIIVYIINDINGALEEGGGPGGLTPLLKVHVTLGGLSPP